MGCSAEGLGVLDVASGKNCHEEWSGKEGSRMGEKGVEAAAIFRRILEVLLLGKCCRGSGSGRNKQEL